MKELVMAVGGGLVGLMLALGAMAFSDSDDPIVTWMVLEPTPFAAPSPSELSCPVGFIEVQRRVITVEGGADKGWVSCDMPGRYNLSLVSGSAPVLRDWRGNEVTGIEKDNVLRP